MHKPTFTHIQTPKTPKSDALNCKQGDAINCNEPCRGNCIAYYRVSTTRQGQSGLGLEAQRKAVANFVHVKGWEVGSEYTEIESGRRNDRPQLALAIADAKKHKAKLVIAKLDRLARNVHFVSGLMETNVDFVAVDMPTADRFMLHVYAAMAEEEGRRISQRTKAALAAAKARGIKLGANGKVLGEKKLESIFDD